MRGPKETLGGVKEGAKTKGRQVERIAAGKGMKPAAKTSAHAAASGPGGPSASRKASTRKGVTSK